MQFIVAVSTHIMAVFVAMGVFVRVSVAMRVRMDDVAVPMLVGMFVRVLV